MRIGFLREGAEKPDFNGWWLQRSDLGMRSTQLSINVKPVTASAESVWTLM
jgi:hypothetical protein